METIELYVDNVNDCYHPFDYDDLSADFISHIDSKVGRTKTKDINISIVSSKKLSDEDQEALLDSIKAHYKLEYYYNRKENRQMHLKNIGIFIIGVLILIFKNHIPMLYTISDITDIFGCFAIWSAVENILFTDYRQDSYLKIIKKVVNSKITFKVKK